MKSGIAIFVVIAVLANVFAGLWLIWWTNRGVKVAPQETTHIWDDDLTEYNNPMPRWWLWLFILSIAFALAYLAFFPGLGNYRGLLNWTSVSEFSTDDTTARDAFERRFAAEKGKGLLELSRNPAAMTTAKNLFALNCSSCHGSDARGAKGFPNLTDQDWMWGGSEQAVYQTIAQGRNNAMPGWGPVLGADGVEQVMAYVLSLSGRHLQGSAGSADFVAAGKVRFTTMCSVCHGNLGTGNQALGAPNLTDSVWLHGGSVDEIRETIAKGRSNAMPAHLERLGDTKVRLLAAYVLSLSRPVAAVQVAAVGSGEAHAAE
jgi:cytochrome c oxidase cbb3-type subunit 3